MSQDSSGILSMIPLRGESWPGGKTTQDLLNNSSIRPEGRNNEGALIGA